MRLIAGLGNPGAKYSRTRHNIGFMVLDSYLGRVNWRQECSGMVFDRGDVLFCKPLTFMNASGESLLGIKGHYGLSNEDILVVCDDLYLPEGTFRFGVNKSHGGHNGLRDIISKLGGKDFWTLRIGIGPREKAECISDYVMEDLDYRSMFLLSQMYPVIFESFRDFAEGMDILELQNKYNSQ